MIVRTLEHRAPSGARWKYFREAQEPVPVNGQWSMRFLEGGPVLPEPFMSATAQSWTARSDAEAHRFAGTARYSMKFDAPKVRADRWQIDLGDVRESARVRLNGKEIGTALLAPWRLPLDRIKPKDNLLEVDVTSVAANRIRDLDRRKVIWRIFNEINFVNIDYKRFDASNWPVRECGLLGPVRLIPMRSLDPRR